MIGLFGGTFDPVHFGHLRVAVEIYEALALDELRFIPCHQPPHRPAPVASSEQRVRLLQAALEDMPGFSVDERELARDGSSYTIDTLQSFRDDDMQQSICLLVGMDAFAGLTSWHRWTEIIGLCHLVVMTRPDSEDKVTGELSDFVSRHVTDDVSRLSNQPAGLLYFQSVTALDISASRIRTLLAAGRSADYLSPLAVINMIKNENIYSG